MSGIQCNMRFWVALILAVLVCLLEYPAAAEDDLSRLSDVELYFHEDAGRARAVLEERTRTFTKSEFIAFQNAIREASDQRLQPLDARSPIEVYRVLKEMPLEDDVARTKELMAFRNAVRRSDVTEKASIRSEFLADWRKVNYPSIDDKSAAAQNERGRFRMYLTEAASLCDNESDLLAMLEEQCLNRDVEGGMLLFLEGLAGHGTPAGPKIAAWVEALFTECPTWGFAELGYSDRADALPYLYGALSACGRDGLDALLRLGRESTALGSEMLGRMDLPEAEAILWDIYLETSAEDTAGRLSVLSALTTIQSREPTDERKAALRRELPQLLRIPEGVFNLVRLGDATEIAKSTGDPWFLTHITALEEDLKEADMTQTSTYQNYPEGLSINVRGLDQRLQSAKKTLQRIALKQEEAVAAGQAAP